jgi:hypothetical protein
MHRLRLRKPSPAMAVAVAALVVGGRRYRNRRIRPVQGRQDHQEEVLVRQRLKNHTITGNQVKLSLLGKVPNARNADSAANADNATKAVNAANTINASNVGGVGVAKFNFRAPTNTAATIIVNAGGRSSQGRVTPEAR